MRKYEEEDRLLSQLLLDVLLVDEARKQMAGLSMIFDGDKVDAVMSDYLRDALSSYLREVRNDGDVSVTNVYAARLWLAGQPNAARVLARGTAQSQNIFQFRLEPDGTMDVGGGVRWLGKDTELLSSIHKLSQRIDEPVVSRSNISCSTPTQSTQTVL